MHNSLYIILFCLLFSSHSFGLSVEDAKVDFQKASELYIQKEYGEAAKLYQELVDNGYQSFELFFNLGNAYFKSNEIAPTLLYYYKANKLKPNDKDLKFNIQFAEQQTIDKIETPEEFFLSKWWKSIFLTFSLKTWKVFLFSCLFLALGGFVFYLYVNEIRLKKLGFYAGIVLGILGVFFYILGTAQNHYFNTTKSGIIFNLSATVTSAPENGEKLFILHEGTKINILKTEGESVNIALPNGKEGWIEKGEIREI